MFVGAITGGRRSCALCAGAPVPVPTSSPSTSSQWRASTSTDCSPAGIAASSAVTNTGGSALAPERLTLARVPRGIASACGAGLPVSKRSRTVAAAGGRMARPMSLRNSR